MVFVNRTTGKLQVVSQQVPELGYIPISALYRLVDAYASTNPKKPILLKQSFTLEGEMEETTFTFSVQFLKLLEMREQAKEDISESDIAHYFGGGVIATSTGKIVYSTYGGYINRANEAITAEYFRSIELPRGVIEMLLDSSRLSSTSSGDLYQNINTNCELLTRNKQALLKLGVSELGGCYFAAREVDPTFAPSIYLLIVSPPKISLTTLQRRDLEGLADFYGITVPAN